MVKQLSWFDIYQAYSESTSVGNALSLPAISKEKTRSIILSSLSGVTDALPLTFIEPIAVSGWEVTDSSNVPSLAVVVSGTSVSKKHLFKAASLCLARNHALKVSGHVAHTKVTILYVNKHYTLEGDQPFYLECDVTDEVDDVINSIEALVLNYNVDTQGDTEPTEYQVATSHLPNANSKKLKLAYFDGEFTTKEDISHELLSDIQLRVHLAHINNTSFVDEALLRDELCAQISDLEDVHFLDFEATQFLYPTISGVKPFEQVAFQYSSHYWNGKTLSHKEFISFDKSCEYDLCVAITKDLAGKGKVLTYNASFERMVLVKLSKKFPPFAVQLLDIADRLVDLMPIFKQGYYHVSQNGSWSLKAVLPTVVGSDLYAELDGIANGQQASNAYQLVANNLVAQEDITQSCLAYCHLDTLALVYMYQFIIQTQIIKE